MLPGLRSAYDYVSSGFPWGKASVGTDSHLAKTSSPWGSVGICKIHVACRFFFSFIILVIHLTVFSFPLLVTHAIAVLFLGNSVVSQIFSPKIQQGENASQISYMELLTTTPNPRNFSDSIGIIRHI